MSRSDGVFPSYSRYELNPEIWPSAYWDRSYRCTGCGTHWPQSPFFVQTPCCAKNVEKTNEPPDMRWSEAVFQLNESRFNKLYAVWNDGKTDEELVFDEALKEIERIEILTQESSRA